MLGGQTLPQFPSFGIPINANGPSLLGSNGPNHFYLSDGGIVADHLRMGSFESNMEDFDQLFIAD
jgi:hypothetical protein